MNQAKHIKDAKTYVAFRGNWRRSWKSTVEAIKGLKQQTKDKKLREWQRRAASAELQNQSTIARSLMIAREQVEYDKAQRMMIQRQDKELRGEQVTDPQRVPAT